MRRINDYSVEHDGLNWILKIYGSKEKFLKDGEEPKEVVKSTTYYGSYRGLVRALIDKDLSTRVFDSEKPIEDLVVDALMKLLIEVKNETK